MKIGKISENTAKEQKIKNKGFIRGEMTKSAITTAVSLPSIGIIKSMKTVSQLSPKDTVELRKATQEGLKASGLYEKGVRVFTIKENPILKKVTKGLIKDYKNLFSGDKQEEALDSISKTFHSILKFDKKDRKALNAIQEELSASPVMQKYKNFMGKMIGNNKENKEITEQLLKTITEMGAKGQAIIFKEGQNACFLPHANKIITPNMSLQTSVFHEMGHALNANGGILMKGLQKMRPMAMIVPGIILMTSLLNKRKTTDEKLENNSLKNRLQNGADFVKRNAGKLTAAAMAPMVIEEGLATIRGEGIAKKLVENGSLSKEVFKKIRMTNLGGFATYTLALIGVAAGTKIAIDVKDKIQEKYEQKKLSKQQ